MKVAALVHFSLPWRCAGSEVVLHELMKAAHDAGHETTVWCTHRDHLHMWKGTEPETSQDGIRVVRSKNVLRASAEMRRWNPDVIVTHHQHTMHTLRNRGDAKVVYLVHNDYELNQRPLALKPELVVFNADHTRRTLTRKYGAPSESMTFHPPLTPDRHLTKRTGDAITLVNLNVDKGAHVFYRLAKLHPERKFLGVVGGHGVQIVKRHLPNVTIVDHGPDMKQVWSQTRVLLMPSVAESYGLVAQEAGLNGIPTIAHPTTGLVENLGPNGMFADREHLGEWSDWLNKLDDKNVYAEASAYATKRANEAVVATRDRLKGWTNWLAGV